MLAQVKIIISSETKSPRRGPAKETKQKAMPEENVQTETPAKSQNNKKYKEKKVKAAEVRNRRTGGARMKSRAKVDKSLAGDKLSGVRSP